MADKLLSNDFLKKYKNKNPNWGFNGLGYVVYKRTYSRLKEDGSTEEWWETVARCIEGAQAIGADYTEKEAERLYDLVFNLKCNFAGRMLWQLGTKTVERYGGASLLNCYFISMNQQEDFCFLFENLMLGGGVGFSVQRADIHELPKVKVGVEVTHQLTKDADFIVPDSREGWVSLLRNVVQSFFVTGKSFTYSTILVRGKGEKIASFGGTSSGPGILVEGINGLANIFRSREGKKLRSIDVLDINNIIGSVVVAGNVRRCLPSTSLVHSRRGLVPIKNLSVGDEVLTASGYRSVLNVFEQGKQATILIKTQDGSFECTPNHRMAVLTGTNEYRWVIASDLVEGDRLVTSRASIDGSTTSFSEWITKYRSELGAYSNEQVNSDSYERCFKQSLSLVPVRVLSVEPCRTDIDTYDIEVEGEHEFFCEGYLTHNSAQIAIGDPDDHLFLRAKNWAEGNIPNWRQMSNNSIYADSFDQISRDVWETGYQPDEKTGKAKGEPYGFINLPLSRKYGRLADGLMKDCKMYPTDTDNCEGVNPCAEVTLADGEACNLAEIYLNNIDSQDELIECAKLLYKTQKCVWTLPFYYDKTKAIVKKNMRIGLGVTGICQSIEKLDWLDKCYKELRKFDTEWSNKRGWPRSIKLTTVKPSGTLSLLAGSSPGGHPFHSEFAIRRVRMSSTDKLVPYCKNLGYRVEYVKNLDGSESRDTVVVEFPCESGKGAVVSKDLPAIKQLELTKKLQTIWSDNSVSVTIYYRKEELPDIQKWMKENYETCVKSASFCLHTDHGFIQAPYEEITKEQYDLLLKGIKPVSFIKEDIGNTVLDVECANGVCPVR